MRSSMDKKTLAIIILASIIVIQGLLLTNRYARWLLLDIIEPTDDAPLVLMKDVTIIGRNGEATGVLPRGVMLHQACRHDLVHTDPGDIHFYKIYMDLRLSSLTSEDLRPAAEVPKDFPFFSRATLKSKDAGQGNADE
jgi:hypothetical protein